MSWVLDVHFKYKRRAMKIQFDKTLMHSNWCRGEPRIVISQMLSEDIVFSTFSKPKFGFSPNIFYTTLLCSSISIGSIPQTFVSQTSFSTILFLQYNLFHKIYFRKSVFSKPQSLRNRVFSHLQPFYNILSTIEFR